jgi:hypothetical protein
MSDEESVRKLAEVKAYLEKRMLEIQDEASKLKLLLEVVDASLAERSFKKMELPKPMPTPPTSAATAQQEERPQQIVPLKTPEGVHLADAFETENELIVTPAPSMKFDVSAPPFRAFLVGRVLEPMRSRDDAASRAGEISPDQVLSYTVEQEGSLMKRLIVRNYGDDRRLQELRNAIRWTLRRIYERTKTAS